ncbi:MAG TPA: DUF4199 domain-containing protein [Prolixibacteraceae bacterium]|nr:DUF4199 domain-containing protein [Prolixibacteraceae bacterium]
MEQKSTFWRTAAMYALYLGIVLTLYSVVLYVTGQMQNKYLPMISYVFMVIGIFMAQKNYRDNELDGSISYGQAVGFGTAVMLFVGIISALYALILFKVDPSLIDQMIITQEEDMLKKGMTEEQIEASMAFTSKIMTPVGLSIMTFLGSIFMGTIISLVTSIFVKRQPNVDAFDEAMEDVKTVE